MGKGAASCDRLEVFQFLLIDQLLVQKLCQQSGGNIGDNVTQKVVKVAHPLRRVQLAPAEQIEQGKKKKTLFQCYSDYNYLIIIFVASLKLNATLLNDGETTTAHVLNKLLRKRRDGCLTSYNLRFVLISSSCPQ